MKLKRLVEMIREDSIGAEEWPVIFASYKQNAAGEWYEIEDVRQPITSVMVDEAAKEVLVIADPDSSPLSLAKLMEELARLMPCRGDYDVDHCVTPIELVGESIRIDIPIVGTGRYESNRCYLLVYASKFFN
jgi:hypothetical protein